MAVSQVKVFPQNINSFMQARPLAGGSARAVRAGGRGQAQSLAARMAIAARVNAATRFNQRTTSLVTSVVPIVRQGRGGELEVGVGTTVEHGKWLEIGTDVHVIEPRVPFNPAARRGSRGRGYLLVSGGPRGKGPNPDPLDSPRRYVLHPGSHKGEHWLSDAVRQIVPGSPVRVRTR